MRGAGQRRRYREQEPGARAPLRATAFHTAASFGLTYGPVGEIPTHLAAGRNRGRLETPGSRRAGGDAGTPPRRVRSRRRGPGRGRERRAKDKALDLHQSGPVKAGWAGASRPLPIARGLASTWRDPPALPGRPSLVFISRLLNKKAEEKATSPVLLVITYVAILPFVVLLIFGGLWLLGKLNS